MAQRFAAVAEEQEIGRIVFLGGLHPSDEELSEHLGFRVEVGEIFLDSKVPTAALQAGVVLGQGSIFSDAASSLGASAGRYWSGLDSP